MKGKNPTRTISSTQDLCKEQVSSFPGSCSLPAPPLPACSLLHTSQNSPSPSENFTLPRRSLSLGPFSCLGIPSNAFGVHQAGGGLLRSVLPDGEDGGRTWVLRTRVDGSVPVPVGSLCQRSCFSLWSHLAKINIHFPWLHTGQNSMEEELFISPASIRGQISDSLLFSTSPCWQATPVVKCVSKGWYQLPHISSTSFLGL